MTSFTCLGTVAIHTANFTFCYFILYRLPRNGVLEQLCYIGRLVSAHMVKLEDADISLTAIDAGVTG